METLLGDRYRLGDRIGTGGTAQVYEAHDERLDRQVAVKVLDEAAANTADPALRRRFESEARTAARFVHPNAVTIFDAGTDDGSLYLVMELVSGGSLAQHLGDSGPMTSDRTAAARSPGRVGTGCGARGRDHPPRRQAGERPARRRREREARRLRHRPPFRRDRRVDDLDRHGDGHPHVRVARAGLRPTARPGDRHLLARRHAVRSRDRRASAIGDRAGA